MSADFDLDIHIFQATLVENAHLKAEIRKLRIDNADLLRRVRFADTNAHYMRVCVLICRLLHLLSS